MQEKDNIFKSIGKEALKVPEGYFDELKERLDAIPATNGGCSAGPARILKPCLALAACFMALLVVGNVVLRSTAGDRVSADDYSEMAYVDLIPAMQADEYLNTEVPEQETISDEDVVNYLIDSGASAELIEYAGLLAKN